MIGTCKLCLKQPTELCNSHIIPEFNYKPCYDENHRFFRLSTKGPKNKSFAQKGYREHLLCQDCETKFSRWESYAKQILMDGGLEAANKFDWGYEFHGVDYSKFKLYLLSVLWRMGVSSLDMFEMVTLGKHEEKMRLALMADDPLDEHVYPVLFVAVILDGRFISDFIIPPSTAMNGSIHLYRCVISGILYTFCVGSHRIEKHMEDFAIHRDGVLKIPVMNLQDIPYLYDYCCEIHKAIQPAESNHGE